MADEDVVQPVIDAWDARAQFLIEQGQNWPPLAGAPLSTTEPPPLVQPLIAAEPALGPTAGVSANQTDTGVMKGSI